MSGVLKALTGGSSSTSKPVDLTPEAFKELQAPFSNSVQSLIANQGRPAYTGELNAPISQGELTGLGQTAGAAYNPFRTDLLNKTLQGYFLPGQAGANPFLQSAIEAAQRPTEDALNRTLSRTLPGTFTAAGAHIGGGLRSANPNLRPGNTAFDLAASNAFTGGANALKDIATNLSFQGYQQERQNQQQAVQLQQADVDTMVKNLTAQALPRLIQQQGFDKAYQEFNDRLNSFLQALQLAQQAGSPVIANQQKSSSVGGLLPALFPKGVGGGSTGGSK